MDGTSDIRTGILSDFGQLEEHSEESVRGCLLGREVSGYSSLR